MSDASTRDTLRRERNRAMLTAIGDKYAPQMDALDQPSPTAVACHGIPLSPVRKVDPKTLIKNPKNTFQTLSDEDFVRLLQDIDQRGILVPLMVAKDKRTVLAGHNRLRVALDIGLERVPVQFVETDLDDAAERRLLVADNVLRRQLSDTERAAYLAELYPAYFDGSGIAGRKAQSDHGDPITATEVAKAVGVSVPTIKRAKAIHKAAHASAAKSGREKPDEEDYTSAKKAKLSPAKKEGESASALLDGILAEESMRHTDDKIIFAIERIRDRCLDAGLIR